ncbi:uncharacterized protein LOC144137947 isoform X2 [Haemaphysalis longicornis]
MDKRNVRLKIPLTSTAESHDPRTASSVLPVLLSACKLTDCSASKQKNAAKSLCSQPAFQGYTPRKSSSRLPTQTTKCGSPRTPVLACLSPPQPSTRSGALWSESGTEANASSASLPEHLRSARLAAYGGSVSPSRERQRLEGASSLPRTPQMPQTPQTPQSPSPYVPASSQCLLHRLRGCADSSSASLSLPRTGDHGARLLKTPTRGQTSSTDSTGGGRLNSGTQKSLASLKIKTPPYFNKFRENPEFFKRRLALSDVSDDSEDEPEPAKGQHRAPSSSPSSPLQKSSPPRSLVAREPPRPSSKTLLATKSSSSSLHAKGASSKAVSAKVLLPSHSRHQFQQQQQKSSTASRGSTSCRSELETKAPRPANKENTAPSKAGLPKVAYGVSKKEPRTNGRSRAPSAPYGSTFGGDRPAAGAAATQGSHEAPPAGRQQSWSDAVRASAPAAQKRSLLSLLRDPKPPEENYYTEINGRKYHMLSLIGRGGSCKVFVMFDKRKNLCAVKIVSMADVEQEVMKMFLNEVSILKALRNCERVVKLYDYEFNNEDKVLALVMEKGDQDLASVLASMTKKGPLSPVTVKFYWSEMLHAVLEIHDKGVIHSDLKPANFLFAGGKLKLIDFGIADTMQADVTSILKENAMGTLNFMSPESIQSTSLEPGKRCLKISRKSDVWSLGCILYHLAYGKTPFQHISSLPEKMLAITSHKHVIDFPPLPNPHLRDVLMLCLQRDAKQRPTISELLEHPYLVDGGATADPTHPRKQSLQSMFNEIESLSPGSVQKLTEVVKSLRQRKQ